MAIQLQIILVLACGVAGFFGAYFGVSSRLHRIELLLERLNNKVTVGVAGVDRIEGQTVANARGISRVEDEAAAAKEHAEAVAADVQAGHDRANAVKGGTDGAAADAAAQLPEPGASE